MGIGTIARRTFFIGSAAIAGGVAFGVYAARRPFDNPLEDQLAKGEATFNPWVMISSDKITLIAPHADKGQGVFSAQAALIAEELDVDLGQSNVEISFGMPNKAYWNSAIAGSMANSMIGVMPHEADDNGAFARTVIGGIMKLALPMQATGGSSTMPDTFVKLREAGAVARETLKAVAAKKYGFRPEALRTQSGQVILPDGKSVAYTALAADAAGVSPVQNVLLRDKSAWKHIGRPMQRADMRDKLTAKTTYSVDVQMDGMLYAAIRTNPRQGGALVSYDASAAETMRGVQQIVPVTNGVAVIADNTWRAFQAVDAISVEWGEAPYPAEQSAHWQAIADAFTDDQLNALAREEGDVVAAFDTGARDGQVLEAEYKSPYVAHAPLEPLAATVLVQDERVDIWTGHQIPISCEEFVAEITGVGVENVHLHNQFMGGSFGHRLEFEFVKQAAEIAHQAKGTPVKMTYSREEDFAHDFPRHPTMGRGKGAVKDGQVASLDLQLAAPSVMGSQMSRMGVNMPGPDAQLQEGSWDNPYLNLPNLRVRSYRAQDLAPVSSWRSVGAAPNGFIFDSFLDELIHQAGADPLMERIRLMGDPVSVKVLEAVGEMANWGEVMPQGKGRGVAFVMSFGVPTAEIVEVTHTPQGIKIDRVWVAVDVGTVVDPVNFENLVQGGVVFGLGHAINCEITYRDGMAEQTNYHAHEGMRLYQCPEIQVRALENLKSVRGIGEPPVPPAAPALANAIFAATGQRIRELPLGKHINFV